MFSELMGCVLVWGWRVIVFHLRWHCQGFPPLPLSYPSALMSQHCVTKPLSAPWFDSIINRAQTVLPACLYASLLIPPSCSKPIQLCGFICSSVRVSVMGMDGSRTKKKRRRWIYLYWTLGKNHSVKYATERTVSSLRVLQHGCL